MESQTKTKLRGFVMTGGGAKGLYEAGVIHAFHITGMEFDVITGSSIGAMNSIFFAEYLYCKRQLPEEVQRDPLQALERMDSLVKAYHHAWLLMPDKRVIDDSAEGPLGKLKDDLLRFKLSLPQVTHLAWWWTDPDRRALPPPGLWPALLRLGKDLADRLGGVGEVLRIFKFHRPALFREALRTYLARFSLDRSLIPDGDDARLSDVFTQPVSPLRLEHLDGDVNAPDDPQAELLQLIHPERTLRDYAQSGVDVRLTRANYRTGRLEISAYVPVKDFVRFLEKQAWRIDVTGPEKLPLGSFRLQVPGNPVAINAALCSGRFPGVFRPYPLQNIYPQTDPENHLLYRILAGWLSDPEVEGQIKPVYQALFPRSADGDGRWSHWQRSQSMREFFPLPGDAYLDGGAIDNTPSNSAVDYVREWIESNDRSKRDVVLELFVIFLGTEPKVDPDEAQDPTLFEVVRRTLAIQGAAKQTSDANTVDTINTFGRRAEQLGRALELLLESYQETLSTLDEDQRRQVQAGLQARARALGQRGFLGQSPDGILDRMSRWTADTIAKGLPLQVDEVEIYPEKMPLDTLQFTERFGYRKENAIQMLVMGCYNTLWAMRKRLEGLKPDELDDRDRQALALTRQWMGGDAWPTDPLEQDRFRREWRCQRTACVFHARHCPHGASGR